MPNINFFNQSIPKIAHVFCVVEVPDPSESRSSLSHLRYPVLSTSHQRRGMAWYQGGRLRHGIDNGIEDVLCLEIPTVSQCGSTVYTLSEKRFPRHTIKCVSMHKTITPFSDLFHDGKANSSYSNSRKILLIILTKCNRTVLVSMIWRMTLL